ncbi:hypothetical protein [Legionella oakridgensis]|uniref:hypothetical protein n=1 Tax=Legionella oakridgensis TaxID=29423 RepID=UPI003B75B3C2
MAKAIAQGLLKTTIINCGLQLHHCPLESMSMVSTRIMIMQRLFQESTFLYWQSNRHKCLLYLLKSNTPFQLIV